MSKSIWPVDDKTEILLDAAKSGDSAAVNQLLERHRQAVRRVVELRLDRKVQQRVDVSDVVQDVMIEAVGRLDKFLDTRPMAFHLWLRQIAWDRMIDTYRRHRVSAKRNLDREQQLGPANPDASSVDLAGQLCDPAITPAAAAIQAELARSIESAIELLDETDREIVLMRHYEHLSNQEVAEVLGLNPPAASMRYLRAVRRLREVLSPKPDDDGPNADQNVSETGS